MSTTHNSCGMTTCPKCDKEIGITYLFKHGKCCHCKTKLATKWVDCGCGNGDECPFPDLEISIER